MTLARIHPGRRQPARGHRGRRRAGCSAARRPRRSTSSDAGSAARRCWMSSSVVRSSSKMASIARASSRLPSRPRLAASSACRCETAKQTFADGLVMAMTCRVGEPEQPIASLPQRGDDDHRRALALAHRRHDRDDAARWRPRQRRKNHRTSSRARACGASSPPSEQKKDRRPVGGRRSWKAVVELVSTVSDHRRPHHRPAGPLGPLSIGTVDHRAIHRCPGFYYIPFLPCTRVIRG